MTWCGRSAACSSTRLRLWLPTPLLLFFLREGRLYEYWAHQASIVPTEDRALHAALPPSWADPRTTEAWMTRQARFTKPVLERLAASGSGRAPAFRKNAGKDG